MSEEDRLPARPQEDIVTPHPEEFALAQQIVELERAKVGVEAKAIQASDDEDKRRAEFFGRKLELDDEADQRRTRLAGRTLAGVFVGLGAPVALFLVMAFWGDEAQRTVAIEIMTTGGIALAGYGVIQAVSRGVSTLLNRSR